MSKFIRNDNRFFGLLASRELSLILFLLLCALLIPRTFSETDDIRLGTAGSILFAAMGLNLVLCTLKRMRSLSRPVMVMHAGTLVVLAGGVISSFGYVATVNIYEGTSVDKVYRWDLKKDMPLGVKLAVKKIDVEHYPIPVRVGVRRGDEKVGLFELKTGESFSLHGYTVRADALTFPSEVLTLSIFSSGELVGTADTAGVQNVPDGFPYDFVLVAFRNPALKRVLVDLELSQAGQVVASGVAEVNSPLTWEKNRFYTTAVDTDRFGVRYAGIQITNDPGRPYVFAGFGLCGAGTVLYLAPRLRGRRVRFEPRDR